MIHEKLQKISQEDKKTILYKLAEIYANDDELLNFMDGLEGDNINFVFDVVFAGNEENRESLREKENDDFQKLIGRISELRTKINKLLIEGKEFVSNTNDDEELKKLEEMF